MIPQNLEPIVVEEFSTFFKVLTLLLVSANIYLYHKKEIGDAIVDHFSQAIYIWLNLGLVIMATFIVCASFTDLIYATFFVCLALYMSASYLYSQYHEAKNHQLSFSKWLSVILLALIHIIGFILIESSLMFLIVLSECLASLILYQEKTLN